MPIIILLIGKWKHEQQQGSGFWCMCIISQRNMNIPHITAFAKKILVRHLLREYRELSHHHGIFILIDRKVEVRKQQPEFGFGCASSHRRRFWVAPGRASPLAYKSRCCTTSETGQPGLWGPVGPGALGTGPANRDPEGLPAARTLPHVRRVN